MEQEEIKTKPIWTDYYLNKYKWYRKRRKCTWYKHEFTKDALELSITFVGTWWALYGNINRYSKVVDKEYIITGIKASLVKNCSIPDFVDTLVCERCNQPNDNDCSICYDCTEEVQKLP